tara:strand:+ start:23336 stop:24271 length:936 start_codon:yes stop_codon:yes gene_type:complete
MIKKILILLSTFLLIIFLLFFTDFFEFNFNKNQITSLKFIFKSYIIISSICFITGEITKNYSQIDKVWSLVPIFIVWYFTISSNFNERMVLMSVLVTIWGLRLTYNFSRKGGYSIYFWKGEEDYRWKEVRKSIPFFRSNFNWSLFNLFFICFYQMGLIFMFTMPILSAWQGSENPVNLTDYILTFLMLLFIIVETISDQQQYNFQSIKYIKIKNGEKLEGKFKDGFISNGLWGFSRHPNFTSEQLIWITFYLFSFSANNLIFNWSIIGCVMLVILFNNSAKFSEEISLKKYPKYAEYQKSVPMFIGKYKKN